MKQIRGYIHAHSRHSYDGKLSLAEIREKSLGLGISFVAMTEHTDKLDAQTIEKCVSDCHQFSDSEFIFLAGFELPYKNCHILIIGASDIDLDLEPVDIIRSAKERGAWIVLAHPHRNQYQADPELMSLLDGIEIWNQQYDGKRYPRMRSLKMFEQSSLNTKLLATAGLDLHRASHFGGPCLSLWSKDFSEEVILDQLKKGLYKMEGGKVILESRPRLVGIEKLKISLLSMAATALIGLGKAIGKWAHAHNLAMPRRLKEAIRRWL